jgi:hypothetical protein
MYVTITRTAATQPKTSEFLAVEARTLQTTFNPSYQVTITGNMGILLRTGVLAFACLISYFAF